MGKHFIGNQVRLIRERTVPKGFNVPADERHLVSELSHDSPVRANHRATGKPNGRPAGLTIVCAL
jgi:hypothetical protein